MATPTKAGYTVWQIALHWLVALLVLFQIVFGESIKALLRAEERGTSLTPLDRTLGDAHYWVGLAILGLALLRLAIRLYAGAQPVASGSPGWMDRAGRYTHILFYALLVASPVLGLLAYYLGDPFGELHELSKPVFIVLIALHAAAALFHQFWLGDGTLKRMLVPAR
jgi:cytochrome b561